MKINQGLIRTSSIIINDGYLLNIYKKIKHKQLRFQARILIYHRVSSEKMEWLRSSAISPSLFEWQLRYLKTNYQIISLEDLQSYLVDGSPLPNNAAVITFDDGYKDNFSYAFPLLKKHEIPATIFLTTEPLESGKLLWFDELAFKLWHSLSDRLEIEGLGLIRLPTDHRKRETAIMRIIDYVRHLPPLCQNMILAKISKKTRNEIPKDLGCQIMLSWDEVRKMSKNGIKVGAHTITHRLLNMMSNEEATREIMESKRIIESQLQQEVKSFSYPNGRYNEDIIKAVQLAGYKAAVTTVPKLIDLKTRPFELGRILPGWNQNSFCFFVSGLFSDLYSAFQLYKSFGFSPRK